MKRTVKKTEQNQYGSKGIRIRRFSTWSIIIALFLMGLFIVMSVRGVQDFYVLENTTEQYMQCENSVKKFREGLDTLTTQVRLYVMTGEKKYLDSYFQEKNVIRSRENAVDELKELFPETESIKNIETAYRASGVLMSKDFYAMRLVADAQEMQLAAMPKEVAEVTLSSEEQALSSQEKMELASDIVSNDEYQKAKIRVYTNVNYCMDDLITNTQNKQGRAATVFKDLYKKQVIGVSLLIVLLMVSSLIVRQLIINPLAVYNDSIEQDETFPEIGAAELRKLAKTYNKVYAENQETQKLIRHEAEHDALTDLLNRGSFNKLLPIYSQGETSFALILADIDEFKHVNDTYGHSMGDEVIKRVANQLKNTFREIDYVCRVGGDEFAVIVVDVSESQKAFVGERLAELKENLAHPQGDLPVVTMSIGVAFSDRESPEDTIFKDADKVLYYVKEHGKNNYKIY